ncbi:phasin family protein [Duganella sp.]|uniref:phasin family protein n=1 Tax=Duganella sp. TaxID=1904440 RepID=UPI0031CFB319
MFPQLPSPAFRPHAEVLIDFYVDVSLRMLQAMQKLSELNLQLGRDLMADSGAHMQQLMSSKNASQFNATLAAQMARYQPGSQLRH